MSAWYHRRELLGRTDLVRRYLMCGAVWLATYRGIRWFLGRYAYTVDWRGHFFGENFGTWGTGLFVGWTWLRLFGPLALLAARDWKRKPAFLREIGVLLPFYGLAGTFNAFMYETTKAAPIYLILIPLALLGLDVSINECRAAVEAEREWASHPSGQDASPSPATRPS